MEPTATGPPFPPPPAVLRGSCACGLVAYTSSTLPISMTLCHCITCRKLSGAPFLTFGLFHNTALHWTSPLSEAEPFIQLKSSEMAIRGSCRSCGSNLFMKYHCRPDGTSVVMGIVDDDGAVGVIKPKEHIFLQEKARWWNVKDDDGLAKHRQFNEPFQARLHEWTQLGKPRRSDVGDA